MDWKPGLSFQGETDICVSENNVLRRTVRPKKYKAKNR
jgi:hypothetical protein